MTGQIARLVDLYDVSGPFTAGQIVEAQSDGSGGFRFVGATVDLSSLMPKAGGTFTGPVLLNADPITNLGAATKHYVDTAVAGGPGGSFLPLAGGTLTGDLIAGTKAAINPAGVVNRVAFLTLGREWYHTGQVASQFYGAAALAVGTEGDGGTGSQPLTLTATHFGNDLYADPHVVTLRGRGSHTSPAAAQAGDHIFGFECNGVTANPTPGDGNAVTYSNVGSWHFIAAPTYNTRGGGVGDTPGIFRIGLGGYGLDENQRGEFYVFPDGSTYLPGNVGDLGGPVPATANYGLLNVGLNGTWVPTTLPLDNLNHAWDGTGSNHWAGNAAGTLLALLTPTAHLADAIRFQQGASTRFILDNQGNINAAGNLVNTGNGTFGAASSNVAVNAPARLVAQGANAKTVVANERIAFFGSNELFSGAPVGLAVRVRGAASAGARQVHLQAIELGTSTFSSLLLNPDGGNVGVGLTAGNTPGRTLTVVGDVSAQSSPTDDTALFLRASSAGNSLISGFGSTGSFQSLNFSVGGAVRGQIDTNGMWGLGGVAVASRPLSIYGTAGAVKWQVDMSGQVGMLCAPNSGRTLSVAGDAVIQISSSDDSCFLLQPGTEMKVKASFGSTGSFKPIAFWTNNAERLRIDLNGIFTLANCVAAPGSNPSGGGYLYAEAGALKWRGSSGTITTIAAA